MNPIDKLVHELSKLPTVGEKTALRLALHILRQPTEYGQALSRALAETVTAVRFCNNCFHVSTCDLCPLCLDSRRDRHMVCVVEDIADLLAIEKAHSFSGLYHVLHGALSPLDGMGPENLKITELLQRLKDNPEITEVILATNPNVNGDATALYLAKLIKPFAIKISKLAAGIPVGGQIEFMDAGTLAHALHRRLEY